MILTLDNVIRKLVAEGEAEPKWSAMGTDDIQAGNFWFFASVLREIGHYE
jgi:hypothetical protein